MLNLWMNIRNSLCSFVGFDASCCQKKVTIWKYIATNCIQAEWRESTVLYLPCYIVCVAPNQSLFLSSTDDDYSDTYNATYAVINNGERCFTYKQKAVFDTINSFSPTNLSRLLLSGFFCLNTSISYVSSVPSFIDDYSLLSNTTMAHPAPRTHTYRPLTKSPSDNSGPREPSPSPVPPPPPPIPSLLQLRARDSDREKDSPDG